MNAPHALVIGGTGMLWRATRELARTHRVSVLARHPERVVRAGSAMLFPVAADYHDDAQLHAALVGAVRDRGAVELAVLWIHGSAPPAPVAVCTFLAETSSGCRVFHVRGSAAADPSRPDDDSRQLRLLQPRIRYREVVLGFVRTDAGSRWLTDREISSGVLAAVEADDPRYVVGTVEPWEARP